MDLRAYYARIKEVEAQIADEEVVVVSLATPDGGREGVAQEVSRSIAARLIAEGRARLASEAEASEHRARMLEAYQAAEKKAALAKTQFALVSEAELRAIRSALKGAKQ
ncbi:MAG: hypothetical protein IRZ15_09460 [Bryobacteraceae bacterium]|nr:hypothetical protein [Bryobacteraceae bacterium]